MSLTVETIVELYKQRGAEQYGSEAVNQLEHALQCAALAEAEGGSPALVTAALLHDLGHLVHDLGEDPAEHGVDDVHQYLAIPFLRGLFPDAVLEPIKLHVEAKRYLCAVEKGYWESLSFASKRSLELQGGVYSPEDAQKFISRPYAADAVRLRRWDDLAKTKDLPTPDLQHYATVMRRAIESAAVPA
ncbi:MAG TPA: HD domain-containing protein [Burkholderiales bacterium]|nr:HD domain-containing protein [Burkholderiales bacterium]